MSIRKIALLTGGGDCPGLNPAIKSATKKALLHGIEVLGIRDGWKGIVEGTQEYLMPLHADVVRHIDRQGGTILGTSRTNPFKLDKGPEKILANLKKHQIDALIAIGGEDTLGVAHKLFSEHKVPVVGIPKTIDRDLGGTDYTLGFESALEIITDSVDILRSTAESHARIFVVEIMGRHAGHLALRGGISAGASITLIPEVPFDLQKVCDLLAARKARGIRYSIVCVAEGALPKQGGEILASGEKDAFGHVRLGGIAEWLAQEISARTKLECRSVNLSHLQRGGKPVAFDRRLGFYLGIAAVEAVLNKQFGMMASLTNGKIVLKSLSEAVGALRLVNVKEAYDQVYYQAKRSILGVQEV